MKLFRCNKSMEGNVSQIQSYNKLQLFTVSGYHEEDQLLSVIRIPCQGQALLEFLRVAVFHLICLEEQILQS
jgi:hypothetical protein